MIQKFYTSIKPVLLVRKAKCEIYDKGFSGSRRFVKHDRQTDRHSTARHSTASTAQHDKLLLPAVTLKMLSQLFC